MANITLKLSEKDKKKAAARASELGYRTTEAYLKSVLSADLESPISQDLERELLKALERPSREISLAEWQEKRQALIAKHRRAKAG